MATRQTFEKNVKHDAVRPMQSVGRFQAKETSRYDCIASSNFCLCFQWIGFPAVSRVWEKTGLILLNLHTRNCEVWNVKRLKRQKLDEAMRSYVAARQSLFASLPRLPLLAFFFVELQLHLLSNGTMQPSMRSVYNSGYKQ
ncbi:MAG TPA: hypothetical protein VKU38_09335 [Ktedonobacteraceae bacterium]|nr:hypothetical protein [Ktedonobacteraceae bacterium]